MQPDELVVSVDNNPQLADEVRRARPSLRVTLNEGTRGSCATRNVGLHQAAGEVIAFLDYDVVAEPQWLERLVQRFRDSDVMVVGGRSTPAWEGGRAPTWFPRECEFMIGCTGHLDFLATSSGDIRNPGAGNMAVRKVAFDQVGGWEPKLGRGPTKTGGEEAELCLRIKSAMPRARIVYEPSATVHHKVPRARGTLKYVFAYAYSEGIVRAMLRQYVSPHTSHPLAGERHYLRSLISSAIPSRLRRFYEPGSLPQVGVIAACAALVATGYVRGRLSYR